MKKLSLLLTTLLLLMETTSAFAWEKDGGVSCQNVFAKIQNDDNYRYDDSWYPGLDGYVKYVRTEADSDGDSDWEWQVGPIEGDVANNAWVEVNWTPPAGFAGTVEAFTAIYKKDKKAPEFQTWDDSGDLLDSNKVTDHVNCPQPEEKVVIELGIDGPKCGQGHFHLSAYPKINDVLQSGVQVEFQYNGNTKFATTSSPAEVDFDFQGNGQVTAKANGYPSASVGVEVAKDCQAGTPEVLGAATTQGQVLGAMAGTGNAVTDLFNLVFGLGAGLIGAGVKRYAQKNH